MNVCFTRTKVLCCLYTQTVFMWFEFRRSKAVPFDYNSSRVIKIVCCPKYAHAVICIMNNCENSLSKPHTVHLQFITEEKREKTIAFRHPVRRGHEGFGDL